MSDSVLVQEQRNQDTGLSETFNLINEWLDAEAVSSP